MEVEKSKHQYDLSGMVVGDWFLGCPDCGYQYEKLTACSPFCPICGVRMHHCVIQPEDLVSK